MTDEELQASIKIWITKKVANGESVASGFGRIVKNADKNIRLLSEQIQEKRAALEGVDVSEIERALEPYYLVVHREERILVNARVVQKSGWSP